MDPAFSPKDHSNDTCVGVVFWSAVVFLVLQANLKTCNGIGCYCFEVSVDRMDTCRIFET
jgi:hypothetical protein